MLQNQMPDQRNNLLSTTYPQSGKGVCAPLRSPPSKTTRKRSEVGWGSALYTSVGGFFPYKIKVSLLPSFLEGTAFHPILRWKIEVLSPHYLVIRDGIQVQVQKQLTGRDVI
jgi:hypothetical protein